jgi:2-hydroxychromene-2-carboxylate isomerase
MPTIRFHFDFLSPYAYVAWHGIHALAERAGAEVEPVPVVLAALLNHHGQRGPAEIPAKRVYVFKDALRRAALADLPLAMPPSHPFNPLLGLRAVLASPPEHRRALIDGLYEATWGGVGSPGIDQPDEVARVAAAIGLDGEALVARAAAPEVKGALRTSTEQAIALGVFGVPSMLVGQELFWGLDSFDLLERHLKGQDPLTPELLAGLRDVPASASR